MVVLNLFWKKADYSIPTHSTPIPKAKFARGSKGKNREDDGMEGNDQIGELYRWNWMKVGVGGTAFGISILETGLR